METRSYFVQSPADIARARARYADASWLELMGLVTDWLIDILPTLTTDRFCLVLQNTLQRLPIGGCEFIEDRTCLRIAFYVFALSFDNDVNKNGKLRIGKSEAGDVVCLALSRTYFLAPSSHATLAANLPPNGLPSYSVALAMLSTVARNSYYTIIPKGDCRAKVGARYKNLFRAGTSFDMPPVDSAECMRKRVSGGDDPAHLSRHHSLCADPVGDAGRALVSAGAGDVVAA